MAECCCTTQRASPPSRGAWIEIQQFHPSAGRARSPPSRGAWIEIIVLPLHRGSPPSPPSRGAWIEILTDQLELHAYDVAPLAGGVD